MIAYWVWDLAQLMWWLGDSSDVAIFCYEREDGGV